MTLDEGSVNLTLVSPVTIVATGTVPNIVAPGALATQNFLVTNAGATAALTFIQNCASMPNPAAATACTITVPATQPVTIPGANGTTTVTVGFTGGSTQGASSTLTIQGSSGGVGVGSGSAAIVIPKATVSTPTAATRVVGTPDTAVFTVANTGPVTTTFTFTSLCAGGMSGCQTPSPSTATLAALTGSTSVTIISTAGSVGSGTVALQTRYPGAGGTILATGVKQVTVVPPQLPMTLDVVGAAVDSMVTRGQCVTAAIGQAVASECGDLRIIHPLPSVRTLQAWRTPTLIYSSAHAAPFVAVAANLTLPPTSTVPTGVSAAVVINGVTRATASWTASAWTPGAVRRIVLPIDPTAVPALVTGVYTYTLTVTNTFSVGSPAASAWTGKLVVVDRRASSFGAGWWLAGFEKLDVSVPSLLTWTGGDGSVRQYKQRTGSTTIWDAPTITYPDMIRLVAGQYVRQFPDSVSVVFDAQGKHLRTLNRLGHATVFGYDGSGRLSTITLPPTGSPLVYTFHYDGSNHLSSIDAPGASSVRITQVVADPGTGRLTSITDPSSPSPVRTTTFGYAAGTTDHRVRSRTNGRGFVTTFQYDAASKVSRDSLAIAPGFIRRVLTNVAVQGLAPIAVDTATVRFRLDGPRSSNTVAFALNPYGAPTMILDALSHTTRLVRNQPGFPGLVTQLTTVTNHTIDATYDTRGRILTSTEPSTAGAATTTFVWDATWDQVTRVTNPAGDFTDFGVNGTTGNRDWEQDARGLPSQVTFGYDPATKLLSSVTRPGTPSEQYTYDPLGNLKTTTSARGFVTTYTNDNAGRTTQVDAPVGVALNGAPLQTDVVTYSDRNEELTRRTTSGSDFVNAAKGYDAEGNLVALVRTYSGSGASLSTSWHFDGANRPDQETPPGGFAEGRVFDEAGNLTDVTTRRGKQLHMDYDALNRLTTRRQDGVTDSGTPTFTAGAGPTVLQAYAYTQTPDTARFTYTNDGLVLTANNKNADVSRIYHSNGVLLTEALSIRTADRSGFSGHLYAVANTYDADRRRTGTSLTPTALFGSNALAYAYGTAGLLDGVIDAQGFSYTFGYNTRGDLITVSYPGLIASTLGYDNDGFLSSESLSNQGVAFPREPSTTLRSFGVTSRNGRGQILQATDAGLGNERVVSGYDGLGRLTTSNLHQAVVTVFGTTATYGSGDGYSYDGLGNRLAGTEADTVLGIASIRNNGGSYSTATGRLTQRTATAGTTNYSYDAAGNVFFETVSGLVGGTPATVSERRAVFGADERMLASDTRTVQPIQRIFEEYRYDALGRRVWVRANKVCEGGPSLTDATCHNRMVRRTIWDGNRELAEIQAPVDTTVAGTEEKDEGSDATGWGLRTCSGIAGGCDINPFFGRVVYGPTLGTDQPISVTRFGYRDRPLDAATSLTWPTFTIVPYWNYQGAPAFGTFGTATNAAGQAFLPFAKGPTQTACPNVGDLTQQRCVLFQWPFARSAYDQNRGNAKWLSWHGTLLQNKRDGSGLEYRRNRQYDPASGRFTQEDPIGLAGGVNLYGFANGDPITFSDPFGLWPPEVHDAMIASALGSSNADVASLQRASRRFDRWTQFNGMAPWHAMRGPDQSPEAAKAMTAKFVEVALGNAIILESAGNHQGAMNSLAAAMHAEMDATSPAHRDADDEPLPWNVWDGPSAWRKHEAAESGHPTGQNRRAMDSRLRAMYEDVMAASKDRP